MADKIIPHSTLDCKGIASIISKLKEKGRIYDLMAAVALQRGNVQARDVFASHGGDIFIDGLMLSPVETVANFLGVSQEYLTNIMNRYGFTTRKTPDDVKSASINTEFLHCAPYDIYENANGDVSLCHRVRRQIITVHCVDPAPIFITPRAALCVCFLMKYGQKIPKGSIAMVIARNAENGSSYGLDALEMHKKIREENVEKHIDNSEIGKIPREETASVSIDGDVKMTTEFFSEIFKDFSMQFATAFSEEFSKAFAGMQKDKTQAVRTDAPAAVCGEHKNQKFIDAGARHRFKAHDNPENWDELVRKYNRGDISLYGIAKQIGWAPQTVKRHLEDDIKRTKALGSKKSHKETRGRSSKINPENFDDIFRQYSGGTLSVKDISKKFGCSKQTVYNHINRYNAQNRAVC